MAGLTHINFGIVARAAGGDAVKVAAYHACARLEHDGRTFDFTRKRHEHIVGGVLLPIGAPPDLREPGALWRVAEAVERRADAQVARQVLVSIPREVLQEHWQALAQEVAASWVADGAAVQFDVHNPAAADGGEQPHIHFLLTLRRVSDSGFASTKAREWNEQFRENDGRAERQRIADRANSFFVAHGIAARLDPRTLAAQGDNRPPEPQAPQADWQQWKRMGADPESAPPTVAGVLRHRTRRRALASAEAEGAAAEAEADVIKREIAAGRPEATDPTGTTKIAGIGVGSKNPTAVRGRGVASREGGATFIPPKTDPWAACVAEWRADQAAAKAAEKAEMQAEREAGRRAEAAVRQQRRDQRGRVYQNKGRSLVRDLELLAVDRAATEARVRLRAEPLVQELIRLPRAAEFSGRLDSPPGDGR